MRADCESGLWSAQGEHRDVWFQPILTVSRAHKCRDDGIGFRLYRFQVIQEPWHHGSATISCGARRVSGGVLRAFRYSSRAHERKRIAGIYCDPLATNRLFRAVALSVQRHQLTDLDVVAEVDPELKGRSDFIRVLFVEEPEVPRECGNQNVPVARVECGD